MMYVQTLLVPLAIVVFWSLLSALNLADSLFFPPPWKIFGTLANDLLAEGLFRDMLYTLARSLSGFLLSSLIGVPLGLFIGRSVIVARLLEPTVDFLRSVPATALFPLFLFFFGVGDASKVAAVMYGCSLVILVNTAYGAKQIIRTRLLATQVMGATPVQVFFLVVIPESLTGIFAGLRISLSLSLVLVVVTEMFIGTTVGLGYRIVNDQMRYDIAGMYATIFLTGCIGYTSNRTLIHFERLALHWVGK